MKVNYYSVIELNYELTPEILVSFTDKKKAEKHARLLSESGEKHSVFLSEITIFKKVGAPCPYSQP